MDGRRALIIGASGQDGAYLARLLLQKGYVVHGTSRDHEKASLGNLTRLGIRDKVVMHSLSLNDFRSVLVTLQSVKPDEIYNLAGQTSVGLSFDAPVETFESNSIGTLNLLECIRLIRLPARVFNAASSECFGNLNEPADETAPFQPRSPYALSKATAYWMSANYRDAYGLHVATGILFNHESPLRPARFVTQKIVSTARRIAQGSPERLSLGDVDISRDWGWAPEYVDVIWRIMQIDDPHDFVIATGQDHALQDFVREVFARFDLDWQQHVDINRNLFRPSEIRRSVGNPDKARRLLGWEPSVTFDRMIDKLVAEELF